MSAVPVLLQSAQADGESPTDEVLTAVLFGLHDPLWVAAQIVARAFGGVTSEQAEIIAEIENAFQHGESSVAATVLAAAQQRTAAQWLTLRDLALAPPDMLGRLEARAAVLANEYKAILGQVIDLVRSRGVSTDGAEDLAAELQAVWASGGPAGCSAPGRLDSRKSMAELKALIGLEPIKSEIQGIVDLIAVNNMRVAHGLRSLEASNHLVFYGNPGTGKTTVARLVAQLLRDLGVLSSGHLVETQRSGLVAGFVGQTALKVEEIVKRALGGVLFIDEAYSLKQSDNDSFGDEAINVLLKLMEDHRANLVVIVAGYTDEMKTFLGANPGLQSRFNRYLNFPDYSPEELLSIFQEMAHSKGLVLSEGATKVAERIFTEAVKNKGRTFGNGRFARNLFEKCLIRQAGRIMTGGLISKELLTAIIASDIEDNVQPDWNMRTQEPA